MHVFNPRDPMVGVLLDRRLPGVSDLENMDPDVKPLQVVKLSTALQRRWESDACLVSYLPYINSKIQNLCPRLNKTGPVLTQLREKGIEVLNSCLILDYDNPGHRPWTPELLEGFQEAMRDVADNGFKLAAKWNWGYMTLHGARLIYLYHKPVRPEKHEAIARGVIKKFIDRGIALDPLDGWNHLFAAPQQIRVGRRPEKSWDSTYYELIQKRKKPHKVSSLPKSSEKKFSNYASEIKAVPEGLPEYDHALALFKVPGKGNYTQWGKGAKIRLKGRDCYDCVFKDELLAEQGGRDDTICSYVGSAARFLAGYMTDDGEATTPAHLYGLFLESVDQLEPDNATPDWHLVLWNAIRRWWVIEQGKLKEREAVQLAAEVDASEQQMALLTNVREWCDHPEVLGREDKAWHWVNRRLIINLGRQFYVMSTDGYYKGPVNKDMIHSQIVDCGIDKAIELYKFDPKGGMTPKSAQELLNDHAITLGGVVGRAGGKGNYLTNLQGAAPPTLVQSLYRRRTDIQAKFHPDVDTWLKKLFGDQWEIACKWLAWALAFEDGPTCALSLEGKAGSGKKMLVQGLAECLEIPDTASSRDLVGNFQEGLLKSPFVVINEGWPVAKGYMHPLDMFRSLVSGDPTQVNPKFKSVVRINVPCRVLFTANNLGVIRELTKGKTLSPDDREALAIRLLHIDIDPEAATWLTRKGGTAFTSVKGRRWIHKDDGTDSSFIVAEHFFWLYQQRHHLGKHGTGRLLVEGPMNSPVMFELRTQSGSTPVVTDALMGMLTTHALQGNARKGFCVVQPTEGKRGEIWVLASEIKKFHQHNYKPGDGQLSMVQVNEVLKGIVDRTTISRVLKHKTELGSKMWHSLDTSLLHGIADHYGWICPALDRIVEGATMTTFKSAKKAASLKKRKGKTKGLVVKDMF